MIRKYVFSFVVAIAVYLLCVEYVDRAVAIWATQYSSASWIDTVIFLSGMFKGSYLAAFGVGLLLISGGFKLTKNYLSLTFGYIGTSVVLSMAITFGLKLLLGRYRPIEFFQHHLYGFHFWGTQWAIQSSPSGHATGIFAIAMSLSLICKQGVWRSFWFLLAVAVAGSRVIIDAHFLSDVLLGAYIGITVSLLVSWAMLPRYPKH